LDEFAQALTNGDAKAISGMWEVPAFVLGDEGRVVNTPVEVEQFFAGAQDEYNERGIMDTRAEIETLEWPTDRIVLATVRWPYLDADGREVGAESSTYALCRDEDGELKMRVVIMRGVATE
jgi:hypothetical protein